MEHPEIALHTRGHLVYENPDTVAPRGKDSIFVQWGGDK